MPLASPVGEAEHVRMSHWSSRWSSTSSAPPPGTCSPRIEQRVCTAETSACRDECVGRESSWKQPLIDGDIDQYRTGFSCGETSEFRNNVLVRTGARQQKTAPIHPRSARFDGAFEVVATSSGVCDGGRRTRRSDANGSIRARTGIDFVVSGPSSPLAPAWSIGR